MLDNTKKVITFNPRMREMIKQLRETQGYMSDSAVIHNAIIRMHSKEFPMYAQLKSSTSERKMTVEEDRMHICNLLEGKIVGSKCVFFNYSGKKRFLQELPLSIMSDDLFKTQYQPSREKVDQLRKDKKVDY